MFRNTINLPTQGRGKQSVTQSTGLRNRSVSNLAGGYAAGGHRGWPDDTPEAMVAQYAMEWQQDSMTYKEDCPPQADMWASWRI